MVDTVRKINPESFGFLLFMILELFTSEFQYFGMKVNPKKWFSFAVVSISKTTSFKTDRALNFLRKRSQNFISLLLSRLLYIYIYILHIYIHIYYIYIDITYIYIQLLGVVDCFSTATTTKSKYSAVTYNRIHDIHSKMILWVIRKDLSWVIKSQEFDLRNSLFN